MLNKNDRVIIKATEETGTITNIFNVEGTTYYELEDRVKAYTGEELLQYQVAQDERKQTFEDSTASIPVPLDINTPIITDDIELGKRLAIEPIQNDTDPGDEITTVTINQIEYDELTEDSDILKRVKDILNK
ncbi:hypothetical protein ETI08_01095 [Macrococcoides goetzii]|nr:hypothetical protein [Macrococcus goetzii]TDM47759.1 hypothetical protein ETI08_01095 [Macrococcus goetzii]